MMFRQEHLVREGTRPEARLAGSSALFPFSLKVAVLGRAEQITKFGENVAVNRGARVLVCSEKTEALRWLLEGLPTQATSNDKA